MCNNVELLHKHELTDNFFFSEEPSIQSYFTKYAVTVCPFKISSSVSRDLNCPVLNSEELHGKDGESCSATELFEWLGAISNNIDG